MKVIDMLLDTSLFEMAFSRKKVIERARGHAFTLIEHLIKIRGWPDNLAINGWRQTVSKITQDLCDNIVKGKQQPLPKGILFKLLWEEPMEPAPQRMVDSRVERYSIDLGPGRPVRHESIRADVEDVINAVHGGVYR